MFEILFNGQTTYHLVHGFVRQWCFYSEYAGSSRSNILIKHFFKSFFNFDPDPWDRFPLRVYHNFQIEIDIIS